MAERLAHGTPSESGPESIAARARGLVRRLLDIVEECTATLISRLGLTSVAPIPPKGLRDVGPGDFHQVGREFLGYFVELGDLRPGDRVLEIGCGSGRMALALEGYLDDGGRYFGYDVVERSVSWCRRNITRRRPTFQFEAMDVLNRRYNPTGSIPAHEYVFPQPDRSFDFVFLTSVFTHMRPRETRHYLSEIGRLLAPGGRLCCTFFLLNAEQARLSESGNAAIEFSHANDGYRTRDAALPESAIAIEESSACEMLAAAGLRLCEPIRFGSWSGRGDGLSFQDLVVADRAPSGRNRGS